MTQRHKVFISFHSADLDYKIRFEQIFANYHEVIISRSVSEGDIDDGLKTETVRQKIRDEYLRDSTVTVVLVGAKTWQRKHVDWEISSSIRHTQYNHRSGLLGILLPTHPNYFENNHHPGLIPPRLHDNVVCGYADIRKWTENPVLVQGWIHEAFKKRETELPNNSFASFVNNKSGSHW